MCLALMTEAIFHATIDSNQNPYVLVYSVVSLIHNDTFLNDLQRDPNQTEGGVLIPKDYLRIPNGGKVEMRCQVFGPDGDHIYLDWKRSDHRSLPEGSTVHNGVLSIPTVDRNAAGEYICLGLDPAGIVLFRAKSHLEIICEYKTSN